MLKKIIKFFTPKTIREYEHDYLCQASDLTDLENRLKRIEHRPFTVW